MPELTPGQLEALWATHNAEWRDPADSTSLVANAGATDPQLLRYRVRGSWWEVLREAGITLLVTREYEHLIIALRATEDGPDVTFMPLPHPSGLAVDRDRGVVHAASTRNPNQLFDLRPVAALLPRRDLPGPPPADRPLVPVRSRFYPGCTYMHDLAMIDGSLHANAVGQNVVVRLEEDGRSVPVWWPRCIETESGPKVDRNYLQLNSIAAGTTVEASFFSASTDQISRRRPGHRNFVVDKRGVIFSGATREPVVRGLTRPHSARLSDDGRLWVDNSGYGEVGVAADGRFTPVARLPGWTRGLSFHGRTAFVGTSRVIPRFQQYAPGLDPAVCECGVHALDVATGQVLGSLTWPVGNQIFAIEWIPAAWASGLPFGIDRRRRGARKRETALFYAFQLAPPPERGGERRQESARQPARPHAPAASGNGVVHARAVVSHRIDRIDGESR